ncbi:HIT family protein [Streptosporangium saharense]|uniref:HIT family protein n=1 Tax=Streptosporangium saharense TaxID=1706840 RepID=UPI0033305A8B
MDIGPVTPGHLLVIPHVHAVGPEDPDEETNTHVWKAGHRMGRALRGRERLPRGRRSRLQEVFHFHPHVFPRFEGDGFRIAADWETRARNLLDQESNPVRPHGAGTSRWEDERMTPPSQSAQRATIGAGRRCTRPSAPPDRRGRRRSRRRRRFPRVRGSSCVAQFEDVGRGERDGAVLVVGQVREGA